MCRFCLVCFDMKTFAEIVLFQVNNEIFSRELGEKNLVKTLQYLHLLMFASCLSNIVRNTLKNCENIVLDIVKAEDNLREVCTQLRAYQKTASCHMYLLSFWIPILTLETLRLLARFSHSC